MLETKKGVSVPREVGPSSPDQRGPATEPFQDPFCMFVERRVTDYSNGCLCMSRCVSVVLFNLGGLQFSVAFDRAHSTARTFRRVILEP